MPGTVGLRERDPACSVDVISDTLHEGPRIVLSNSFGFGGQNAALVFAHPEETHA